MTNCCVCNNKITGRSLHPSKCYQIHGSIAHTICSECWWNKSGFASEYHSHQCPGCIKNQPLKMRVRTRRVDLSEFFMDLSEDE